MSNAEKTEDFTFVSWFRKGFQTPLYGPGDILGINLASSIISTNPCNNVGDFNPNNIPAVEFLEPDFPWRFSPENPQSDNPDILRPWICLIVLKEKEFSPSEKAPKKKSIFLMPSLPSSIKVNSASTILPDLNLSYLWAHVEIPGKAEQKSDPNRNLVQEALDKDPERVISRIMCSRHLESNTKYHAFIVPTFKSGVLSGLGAEPKVQVMEENAWELDNNRVELPYYYHWQFITAFKPFLTQRF